MPSSIALAASCLGFSSGAMTCGPLGTLSSGFAAGATGGASPGVGAVVGVPVAGRSGATGGSFVPGVGADVPAFVFCGAAPGSGAEPLPGTGASPVLVAAVSLAVAPVVVVSAGESLLASSPLFLTSSGLTGDGTIKLPGGVG